MLYREVRRGKVKASSGMDLALTPWLFHGVLRSITANAQRQEGFDKFSGVIKDE